MIHPAILLIAWVGLAFALQALSLAGLAVASVFLLPLAAWRARRRTFRLLARARWLFISLALLFAFGTTSGQPFEVIPGATVEGLRMAGEHCLRLLLLLASLASMHEILGTSGLMKGFYALLWPILGQKLRDRTVVRLMLVLDYAETPKDWRAWLSEGEADKS
ncbi:MAG: hypothetical protein OHM77_04840 [Candidatus Nitricoxidivorans perseverans]|uniref:Uncharacterized protein n=1 Tax=Candidatus Nitricoxidivorans perseverans TaxID=2975601 RepID=A0AA49FNF3_9PROT|nr:MAG: hypothetical protein OHM77_04840 [Candidatus Nitricoxidivorans perseverans]